MYPISNDVLNIDIGQEDAKVLEVKVGSRKKICRLAQFEPLHPWSAELADIFLKLQIGPLISLQPLKQNQCSLLHLKDLFYISLEIKAQGF